MGDARLSMKQERPEVSALYSMPMVKEQFYAKHPLSDPSGVDGKAIRAARDRTYDLQKQIDALEARKSPETLEQLAHLKAQYEEIRKNTPNFDLPLFSQRDHYYKVIVVDAFSSDAIPIHLITKEAIELYFSKLAPDGVLCVHTSNRHMNLVAPVSDIAKALGKNAIVGHDTGRSRRDLAPFLGHFGSEYVMLANEEKYLPTEQTINLGQEAVQEWSIPVPPGNSLWTDDFSNIVSILR
jgi:hypothetical protein